VYHLQVDNEDREIIHVPNDGGLLVIERLLRQTSRSRRYQLPIPAICQVGAKTVLHPSTFHKNLC
jgi:hypothetical protein